MSKQLVCAEVLWLGDTVDINVKREKWGRLGTGDGAFYPHGKQWKTVGRMEDSRAKLSSFCVDVLFCAPCYRGLSSCAQSSTRLANSDGRHGICRNRSNCDGRVGQLRILVR